MRNPTLVRLGHRSVTGDGGYTVVETLAAVAILVVAMVALLGAMTTGVAEVDAAKRSTTALFLAEQRLEEIKGFALSTAAGKGFTNVTAANFPAQAYASITGYGDYRRWVTITDNPGGAVDTKQVEVWVGYRPLNAKGLTAETTVTVSSLLVRR
jgi:Tfp pilus assembly protein PilV